MRMFWRGVSLDQQKSATVEKRLRKLLQPEHYNNTIVCLDPENETSMCTVTPEMLLSAAEGCHVTDKTDGRPLADKLRQFRDSGASVLVIDAVDDVAAKTEIIVRATMAGVPVISAMGAGNKLDPTQFKVSDISKTSVCPLARVMRRKLKERGVKHCKVVYSTEIPVQRSVPPASVAFVPSVAGLIIAGEVIRDITGVSPGENNE